MLRLIGELLGLDEADGIAAQFYEKFPTDSESEVQIDIRPGETEEELDVLPGFAESFMYFVLTERTDERPGEWSERIGFFYNSPDMISWRSEIRDNLGLK